MFIKLADALRTVFRYGVELTEQDFQELTAAQYEALNRRETKADGKVYRMLLEEPTANGSTHTE